MKMLAAWFVSLALVVAAISDLAAESGVPHAPRRNSAVAENDADHLEEVARSLNDLGIRHLENQRTQEAQDAFQKALALHRAQAHDNPVSRAEVAATLNNLAVVYHDMERFEEAEMALRESRDILYTLASQNPAYRPDQATTLNNLV